MVSIIYGDRVWDDGLDATSWQEEEETERLPESISGIGVAWKAEEKSLSWIN
jgi:hypothetical protein